MDQAGQDLLQIGVDLFMHTVNEEVSGGLDELGRGVSAREAGSTAAERTTAAA